MSTGSSSRSHHTTWTEVASRSAAVGANECVADLRQQLDVLWDLLDGNLAATTQLVEFVERHHDEVVDSERHQQECDQGIDEAAYADAPRMEGREVRFAEYLSDHRVDDVVRERLHKVVEGCRHDDGHSEFDDVAAQDEVTEALEHAFLPQIGHVQVRTMADRTARMCEIPSADPDDSRQTRRSCCRRQPLSRLWSGGEDHERTVTAEAGAGGAKRVLDVCAGRWNCDDPNTRSHDSGQAGRSAVVGCGR